MNSENIRIYDNKGNPIGSASREEAMVKNLYRGVVRVFLLNKDNLMYVQKRGEKADLAPGLWDQSAGGHIDASEEPEQAALRELKEELGVELDSLDFLISYPFEEERHGKTVSSFDFLFTGKSVQNIHVQKEELSGGRWFDIEELKLELSQSPEKFAPGFKTSFPVFLKEKGLN